MPPVVCRFWQQGNCRNGNNCKFLHSSNPNQQPVSNGNRFAPLQDHSSTHNNGYQNRAPPPGTLPYGLDKSAILVDLTSERPQWILSAYGPGRNAPAQLFGGPMREQSFEEMRLLHYMAVASGNPQQAVQDAEKLYQTSEQQIQTALNNVDGAINFVIASEKDHPNRIDIVRDSQTGAGSQPNPFNPQSPFQQAANTAPNPFGAVNQPPPAVSAFGAPSAPAFGAPSALGGSFGQPSALGQKSSPFGAPTQIGSGGAFGQPSALGQKPNPFGAPIASTSASAVAPFSAFAGTPNPFAQKPAATTPFGAPSQPATSNPFGAPSQPATTNPFGAPPQPNPSPFGAPQPAQSNPFGQPSNPTSNQNPFRSPSSQPNPLGGTPASFGVPPPTKNPFGAPSQPPQGAPNPFGQPPAAPQPNPFGAPSAPAAPNPFGQPPSNPTPATNPFGQPSAAGPPPANPFGTPHPQPGVNGHSDVQLGAQHPQIGSYSTKDASGRLATFKGKRVVYKGSDPGFTGQDGSWQRIWFPDGPPIFNKDTGADEKLYDEKIEAAYKYAKQNGSFQGGMMPLLPPKREWCHWDF